MSNARITLSKEATSLLEKVMAELPQLKERPDTLKLALAKGIAEAKGVPPLHSNDGFVIGAGAIAKGDEYLLIKHLMIEKLGFPIDGQKEVDEYIKRFIEEGLNIMNQEIDSLTNLDNYLLFLVNKVN